MQAPSEGGVPSVPADRYERQAALDVLHYEIAIDIPAEGPSIAGRTAVLYQAGIAPKRRASTLSREEARRLRGKIRAVIGRAVGAGSDSDRFPRWWLFHRRWGHRRGGPPATTVRGEPIRHETVAGRTTAWVPSAQR